MGRRTLHSCPNCGTDVPKIRWDAGYHYCRSRECFEALGKKSGVKTHEQLDDIDHIELSPFELDEVASFYEPD